MSRTQDEPALGLHFGKTDLLGGAAAEREVPVAQVFLSSSRSYHVPVDCHDPHAPAGVRVYVHAPYVINVASDDPTIRTRSRRAMNQTVTAAGLFGAEAVVVHPGSCRDDVLGIARWHDYFEEYGAPVIPVLFENSAGRGIAQRPEQLQRLWEHMPRSCHEHDDGLRVGMCVDTAHAWSAGYDPVHFLQAVDGPVRLLHLNGSSAEFGCGRDRHAAPGNDADLIGPRMLGEAVWQARCDVVMETWDDRIGGGPGRSFTDVELGSVKKIRSAWQQITNEQSRP